MPFKPRPPNPPSFTLHEPTPSTMSTTPPLTPCEISISIGVYKVGAWINTINGTKPTAHDPSVAGTDSKPRRRDKPITIKKNMKFADLKITSYTEVPKKSIPEEETQNGPSYNAKGSGFNHERPGYQVKGNGYNIQGMASPADDPPLTISSSTHEIMTDRDDPHELHTSAGSSERDLHITQKWKIDLKPERKM